MSCHAFLNGSQYLISTVALCFISVAYILTLMAHYFPIKLLLIYTGKSESGVKTWIEYSHWQRIWGEIQCSLFQWGDLALLLHCHRFLQHWLRVSPAGTDWAQLLTATVTQHCVWPELFILNLKVAEFFSNYVILGDCFSPCTVQC